MLGGLVGSAVAWRAVWAREARGCHVGPRAPGWRLPGASRADLGAQGKRAASCVGC